MVGVEEIGQVALPRVPLHDAGENTTASLAFMDRVAWAPGSSPVTVTSTTVPHCPNSQPCVVVAVRVRSRAVTAISWTTVGAAL